VVAIGGLLAGTFLTLLAVPVMFSVLHQFRGHWFTGSASEISE